MIQKNILFLYICYTREFGKADIGVPDADEPDEHADYMFTSDHEESARYIKITITPVKSIPDWHYAAGRRIYVFVDELIVL